MQEKRRTFNQSTRAEFVSRPQAGVQSGRALGFSQLRHRHRDQPVAKVAVALNRAGRAALDAGMVQVHRIRNHRRRRIRRRRAPCHDRHRIRDAKREAASAPARGRDAPHRVCGAHRHPVHPTRGGKGTGQLLALRQPQRDVAAVVGIGAADAGAGQGAQHLFGDGTGDGGHGGDEGGAKGRDGGGHAAGDGAGHPGPGRAKGGKFVDQFFQDGREPGRGAGMGGADGQRRAERLGDNVDGAVVQMEPPPRKQGHDGTAGLRGGQGHGATRAAVGYSPPSAMDWSSVRMLSAWPPIAR